MLNTKYPIICAAMREVNDFNLAYAVHKAGCFPSFFIRSLDDIKKYRTEIDNNFNVFGGLDMDFTDENIDTISEICPTMLEISWGNPENKKELLKNKRLINLFDKLKENGSKIFFREISPVSEIDSFLDGITIKGKESAGAASMLPTKINFLKQKQLLPNTKIIVAGGIYLPDTIKWYIDNGAYAVYIGTPFAMSEESRVNINVKQKLMHLNKTDINISYYTNNLSFDAAKRNSILLGEITNGDNLKNGVNGNGGFIYSGYALDKIDKIVSVQNLVEYMTSSLSF